MSKVITTTFQLRRGNSSWYVENDPVLAQGEPVYELDTKKLKIGDGIHNYSAIPYLTDKTQAIIAPLFDEDEFYSVGEYVIKDDTLYRFIHDHQAEPWDEDDIVEDGVWAALRRLENTISTKYTKPTNGIPTNDIADGAITNDKLAVMAISTDNIDDEAIGEGKIANSAVSTDKLDDGAVTKAKLANDTLEAIYNIYPTETKTGIIRVHTTLGAEEIPMKAATVEQTVGAVPQNWVIHRCGKNLFDAANVVFRKSTSIINSDSSAGLLFSDNTTERLAATETYIPVVPSSRLVSQGLKNTIGVVVYYRIVFYNADKSFNSASFSRGQRDDYNRTVPDDAYFMRFCCANEYIDSDGKMLPQYAAAVQFEILDNPEATTEDATPWEAYHGEDTLVAVTALDTSTVPSTLPTTVFGQNTFSLFPQGALVDTSPITAIDLITQTGIMDVKYRLDPTLVYNSLKG